MKKSWKVGREGGSHTVVWDERDADGYHYPHAILDRDERLRKRRMVAYRKEGGGRTVLWTDVVKCWRLHILYKSVWEDELLTSISKFFSVSWHHPHTSY